MKTTKSNAFLTTALLLASMAALPAGTLYWRTSAASSWTSSSWGEIAGGPYTSAWTDNSDVVFEANGGISLTATGATAQIASITANENVALTASGTLGTSGTVATITVAEGKTLDFAGQSLSTAAGTGFIKNGLGTWISSNGNTYAGGFTLNAGTVAVGGINAMGAGGSLTINGGTLRSNTTTARDLTGKYTAGITVGGDFTLGDAVNNGALTFTNNIALGSATRTITVNSAVTCGGAGVISGDSGLGLTKAGIGALTLNGSAVHTFTGGLAINGGILAVNFGNLVTSDDLINSGNALTLGGSLTMTGKASTTNTQTFNGLTLNSGATAVSVSSGASGSATLTINGTVARNTGSAVSFTLPATGAINGTGLVTALGTSPVLASGWAAVGNDWAITDGTKVIAQTAYTLKSVAGATAANYTNVDAKLDNAAGLTWSDAITPNSLLWSTLMTPSLAANSTNIIGSGGLMFSSLIGTNNASGLNGNGTATITSGNGTDLIIIQNNNAASGKTPYISAIIADNGGTPIGVTKAGSYQADLRGVNTYTGDTIINAGTLAVTGTGQLGSGAYAKNIIINGGSFRWASTASQTLTGVISGPGNFIVAAGTISLGTAHTYSGSTMVSGGTLTLGAANLIPNTAGLVFGESAGANAVSTANVNEDTTVLGLTAQMRAATASTLNIPAGKTLTVNGNCQFGSNQSNSGVLSTLNISGQGTLAINKAGGTIRVGNSNNMNEGVTTDMSGLDTFTANLGATGYLTVGNSSSQNHNTDRNCTLTLAKTNTVTANFISISPNDYVASTGTPTVEHKLRLGSTANTLNVNTIYLGSDPNSGQRSTLNTAILNFATANGTVKIRAADGTSSAAMNVGYQSASKFGVMTGIVDFSGHSADLLLSTLNVGYALSGTLTGTMTFDTGTLDATTINIGNTAGSTGTLNIGGGITTVGSGGIKLGAGGTGTLNLTGGTVTMGAAITRTGGTGTLKLDGAILDMGGYAIGGATAISTLNILSGTLKNVGQINNGATGLAKTGTGTLTLGGINGYTGDTTVSDGTLAFVEAAEMKFALTDTTSNRITGTGTATLDGIFNIVTTAVSATTGSWNLVDVTNLTESFTSNFAVFGFSPNIDGVTWTLDDGINIWTFSETDGNLKLAPVGGASPYQTWADAKGLTSLNNGKAQNPDNDGGNNLLEFALGGDPLSGSSSGISLAKVQDVAGSPALTLTIATRTGTSFPAGSGVRVADNTAQGVKYRIEGGQNLSGWAADITEVTPAITAGLPDPVPAGYEYHTFKTAGPVSGTPKDFIRVQVSE